MDIKSSKWEYGWRKCRGICSFYDHRGRSHCCCCSLPDSSQRFYSRKSQRNVIGKSDCKKINRESHLSAGSVQYTFPGLRSKHRSRTNRSVVPWFQFFGWKFSSEEFQGVHVVVLGNWARSCRVNFLSYALAECADGSTTILFNRLMQ